MREKNKSQYQLTKDFMNMQGEVKRLLDIRKDVQTILDCSPVFTLAKPAVEFTVKGIGRVHLNTSGTILYGFITCNIHDEERLFRNSSERNILRRVAYELKSRHEDGVPVGD